MRRSGHDQLAGWPERMQRGARAGHTIACLALDSWFTGLVTTAAPASQGVLQSGPRLLTSELGRFLLWLPSAPGAYGSAAALADG